MNITFDIFTIFMFLTNHNIKFFKVSLDKFVDRNSILYVLTKQKNKIKSIDPVNIL